MTDAVGGARRLRMLRIGREFVDEIDPGRLRAVAVGGNVVSRVERLERRLRKARVREAIARKLAAPKKIGRPSRFGRGHGKHVALRREGSARSREGGGVSA